VNVRPAPPPQPAPHRSGAALFIGLLLVLFGLTALAGALGFTVLNHALRDLWPWPLILILIGGYLLLRAKGQMVSGLLLILAGAWTWARHQGLLDVPFSAVFWPLVVVLIGGSMLWYTFAGPKPPAAGSTPPPATGASSTEPGKDI
jgi:hypothetical protein